MFHVRTHVQGQRHAGIHQTFPALDGERARVFYEIYPGFQVVGQGFPEFQGIVFIQTAVEVQPPAPGGDHGSQHCQPFQSGSQVGAGLDFSSLESLGFHDANGSGADAGGQRGVAFRNVQAVKQADTPRAGFPVRSGALRSAEAQRQGATLPERVQFLLQGGVSQFRPRLDAAVPAFIRFNEGSLPAYFRGSGVQRAAGC